MSVKTAHTDAQPLHLFIHEGRPCCFTRRRVRLHCLQLCVFAVVYCLLESAPMQQARSALQGQSLQRRSNEWWSDCNTELMKLILCFTSQWISVPDRRARSMVTIQKSKTHNRKHWGGSISCDWLILIFCDTEHTHAVFFSLTHISSSAERSAFSYVNALQACV